jgi:hypothetical protein
MCVVGQRPLGSEKQVFSILQSEARAGDSVSIAQYLHHMGSKGVPGV